jgi:hypothetical protein
MPAAKKLTDAEVKEQLSRLKGWSLQGGKLHREFQSKDFVTAFGNMTRVALVQRLMRFLAGDDGTSIHVRVFLDAPFVLATTVANTCARAARNRGFVR